MAHLRLRHPPPPVVSLLKRGRGTIFMLHRFEDPVFPPEHPPEFIRSLLSFLVDHAYDVVALGELLDRIEVGDPSAARAVAFTIDDGYSDFYHLAAPVFREFECAATVFVTTGFVDGLQWQWWDRMLQLVLRSNSAAERLFEALDFSGGRQRVRTAPGFQELCDALKRMDEDEKAELLQDAERAAGFSLPLRPPAEYAAMTWSQIRELGEQGFRFGPHTVTHPILSRTSDERATREITESWERLCAETDAVDPIFCYPNGLPSDFGEREVQLCRDAGLRGAVTTVPGYVTREDVVDPQRRFRIPRLGLPLTLRSAAVVVSGLERFRPLVTQVRGILRR